MEKKDFICYTGGVRTYAALRFLEEGTLNDVSVGVIHFANTKVKFSNTGFEMFFKDEPLPHAKAVFMRAMGERAVYSPLKLFLIHYYTKIGAKVMNSASFLKWPSIDKAVQYLEFVKAGIPVVESYFFGSKEFAQEWADKNGYPIIAKETIGSMGNNVFKFDSSEQLASFLGPYKLRAIKSLLFQKFLKGGEDIRVIVLGGKVLGAMKRIAKEGNFLTNYSQGGNVVAYDIAHDPEAQKIALDVANCFNLEYCGVDLMKDENGKWIVLEVNRACQFEGFEKATGLNVAKKIIDYLVSKK